MIGKGRGKGKGKKLEELCNEIGRMLNGLQKKLKT